MKNTARKFTKVIAGILAAMTMMSTAAAFAASADDTQADMYCCTLAA